jgi:DNA-binding CsgD family transcriptional regulator
MTKQLILKNTDFLKELNQLQNGNFTETEESNPELYIENLKNKIYILEKILNELPIAVYINDCKSMQQIWGNPQAEKRMGVTVKEMNAKGLSWYLSHYHLDDISIIKDSIKTFTENKGKEYSGVYRVRPEGEDEWHWNYSKSVVLTEDKKGKNELILGIALDLSKQMDTKSKVEDIMKENIKMKNKHIIDSLTKREKQILHFIALGNNSKEIASSLEISYHTVNTHRKKISKKLHLNCMATLAAFAVENGI